MTANNETFSDLLFRVTSDNSLTKEQLIEINEKLAKKVDGLYEALTKIKAESDRLAGIIKDFQAKKKTVDNEMINLKSYIQLELKKNKMPFVKGEKWKVSMRERVAYDIFADPNEILALEYPEVCKPVVSYQFDKDLLKLEPEKYPEIIKQKKSEFIQFNVKSEVKK